MFTETGRNGVNGPRCIRPVDGLYMTEAEANAETDAKAEAKVIITRPRPAIFVYNYNSGSTDLLGQRDLLGSFETANYLIVEMFAQLRRYRQSCVHEMVPKVLLQCALVVPTSAAPVYRPNNCAA